MVQDGPAKSNNFQKNGRIVNTFDREILLYISKFDFRSRRFDYVVNVISDLNLIHLVLVAMLWWIWFRNRSSTRRDREIVVSTILASFVALCAGRLLAHWLPFRVRPFVNPELGITFPLDSPETHALRMWSAFPSDHAMMWCALAAGVFLVSKRLGVIALLYTIVLICLPRIYLGLHHPTDILAGAALGISICLVLCYAPIRRRIAAPILDWSASHEAAFHVAIFLLSFEITSQFEEIRTLSASVLKLF
jgi:membrane-associated phospholipid phosphatase